MKKFNVNTIYTRKIFIEDTPWGQDPYLYVDYKCIKKSNTFATFERVKKIMGNIPNIIRTKIKIDDKGNEYVYLEHEIIEA